MPPRGPKRPQGGPKEAPRGPKTVREAPKLLPRGPRGASHDIPTNIQEAYDPQPRHGGQMGKTSTSPAGGWWLGIVPSTPPSNPCGTQGGGKPLPNASLC